MKNFFLHKKIIFFNLAKRFIDRRNRKLVEANKGLYQEISAYMKKSGSTGCSYNDYWALYDYVRTYKPRSILECGTGTSTIVMAYALKENEAEGFPSGKITSMESVEKYYEMAKGLLPEHLKPYIDLLLSPITDDYYSLFRGVRYENVPMDREYDFVFIDGPSYKSPVDGTTSFNFDFLNIVRHSEKPVSAIVDKRVSTCYVYQKIFGTNRVKYNAYTHLGYIGPCTKYDIKHFDKTTPSSAFEESYSFIGNSKLHLDLKSNYY